MEPWRLLSRGQHDGREVLPRGSGEASLPRPPAPACRSTPPSPRQMQGAAGCVCRQNRTCYPTLPPPGHLAEDVAVWVSDPGQVWKRDRAFKGMGWGREGAPADGGPSMPRIPWAMDGNGPLRGRGPWRDRPRVTRVWPHLGSRRVLRPPCRPSGGLSTSSRQSCRHPVLRTKAPSVLMGWS